MEAGNWDAGSAKSAAACVSRVLDRPLFAVIKRRGRITLPNISRERCDVVIQCLAAAGRRCPTERVHGSYQSACRKFSTRARRWLATAGLSQLSACLEKRLLTNHMSHIVTPSRLDQLNPVCNLKYPDYARAPRWPNIRQSLPALSRRIRGRFLICRCLLKSHLGKHLPSGPRLQESSWVLVGLLKFHEVRYKGTEAVPSIEHMNSAFDC